MLTAGAQLRAPMALIPVDRLNQNAVPDAWKDGKTTALALSIALAAQNNDRPVPWSIMRQAIDAGITSRWLELAPGSGPWPCDMTGASALTLRQPSTSIGAAEQPPGGYVPQPQGVYHASAVLEASALQDLVEVLPDIIKTAAGIPLRLHLSVTLGDGQEVGSQIVASINRILGDVSSELRLRA
ncbi:MAG: hypothetical protein ACREE4_17990 [Stellaceae bacterium]